MAAIETNEKCVIVLAALMQGLTCSVQGRKYVMSADNELMVVVHNETLNKIEYLPAWMGESMSLDHFIMSCDIMTDQELEQVTYEIALEKVLLRGAL